MERAREGNFVQNYSAAGKELISIVIPIRINRSFMLCENQFHRKHKGTVYYFLTVLITLTLSLY